MRAEDIIHKAITEGQLMIDVEGRIWRLRNSERVRAENHTSKGYLQIRKMVSGKRYHACAHRIVWEHFNKQRIPDGNIINHKNGQKDDNRPWNLELSTYARNISHAHKHGLLDQSGEKNPSAKLTDKEVAEIRLAYSTGGFIQKELAVKYGISFQTISKIVRGERRARQMGVTGNYEHLRQRAVTKDPGTGRFISREAAGRLLDGRTWDEMPGQEVE